MFNVPVGLKWGIYIVLSLIFIQSVAASELYIPATDVDGVQFSADEEGYYQATIVDGVCSPSPIDDIPNGTFWRNCIHIFKNQTVQWVWNPPCECYGPDAIDFYLGDSATFPYKAQAEAAGIGDTTIIPMNQGDYLIFIAPDCQDGYGDNRGGVTIEVEKLPEFHIIDTKMVSPNVLGVACNVSFPEISEGKNRKILCTYEIDGATYTQNYPLNAGEYEFSDPATSLIKLNLKNKGVPRFTDNVHFTVTGKATYDGSIASPDSSVEGDILLPVVVLHGYVDIIPKDAVKRGQPPFDILMKGYPGGKTGSGTRSCAPLGPLVLVADLRTDFFKMAYKQFSDVLIHKGYNKERKYPGGVLKQYVTLYDAESPDIGYSSLSYATPSDILKDMNKIYSTACAYSYADKINIVGHSTGGLVGRFYAAKTGGKKVCKVITVGTPNDGIARFYEQPFAHMALTGASGRIIMLEYSDRSDFIEKELIVPKSNPRTSNILTWFAPKPNWDAIIYKTPRELGDPNPVFKNTFNYPYEPNTRYYLIYGNYPPKPTPYKVPILLRDDKLWYDSLPSKKAEGDGYVYLKSAGDLIPPKGENGKNLIRKYIPDLTEEHGTILKDPTVTKYILDYLLDR